MEGTYPGNLSVCGGCAIGAIVAVGGLYLASGGATTSFAWGLGSMALQHLLGRGGNVKGPRLNDLSVQGSDMDIPIPKIFGTARTAGNIIWSTGLKEHKRKKKVGKGGQKVTEYTYTSSFAVAFGLGPMARPLKLWFGNRLIYDYNDGSPKGARLNYDAGSDCYFAGAKAGTWKHSRLWVYRGTEQQKPNPLIEEDKGVGKVPAYRGQIVVVIEDLELEPFGNQLPPVTGLFQNCSVVASDIATQICQMVGIDTARDTDFRELRDGLIEGFIMKDQDSARSYLNMIGLKEGCEFPSRNARITAMRYGRESCRFIPDHELRFKEKAEGAETPSTLWEREQESDLPQRIQVQYLDKFRNYTPNAQHAVRSVTTSDGQETLALPMTMDGAASRKIAERELYRRWLERESVEVQLSWKHMDLGPSDVITINTPAGQRDVRLQGGQTPFFGPLEYSAVLNSDKLSHWPEGENTTPPDYPEAVEPGEATVMMFEAHSVRDDMNDDTLVYAAAASPEGTDYEGVIISPAQGTAGDSVSLPLRATMGSTVNALGDHHSADWWDDESELIVSLIAGHLETADLVEVLNADNAAFVESEKGWELIQFREAEQIGEEDGRKIYRLHGGILRGRRGTEQFMAGHKPGDRFLLLDEAVEAIRMPLSSVGMVTSWDIIDDLGMKLKSMTLQGTSLLPYAPCDIEGERESGGDIIITWKRRSRYRGAVLNDPPLGESKEEYVLKVFSATGETVRTVVVTDKTSYTYTLAQQQQDGVLGGGKIKVGARMVSSEVGEGYEVTGEI